jgi:RHS repeat-associated protein
MTSWTKDLGTDVDFYDCDITYDEGSNILLIEDNIHAGFDVEYTNDDLNRLTEAEEGSWSGSAITSRTRDQQWTLDQVGNWDVAKLDLDGDNNWNEGEEYNDDRTHNIVNELTARDTDDDGSDDHTLTYDEVGNLIDDNEHYEYVYDAFGRLRKILDENDQSLVAEYWYNGLGFLITEHTDTDTDGDVDVNDTKINYVFDDRWRIVAEYEDDSDDALKFYVYHNAGLDGFGGSSYIDAVVVREDDTNGNGTLDRRTYYCQNWRNDVVALVGPAGALRETASYSSYGIPIGRPAGDTDSDGDCDQTDIDNIDNWTSGYDVRYDVDLDGDIDATDSTIASANYQGTTLGWNVLSSSDLHNDRGYAGYRWKQNVSKYEVRHRTKDPHLGRWLTRDPLGYVDGMSVYEYAISRPIVLLDPLGLSSNNDECDGGYEWNITSKRCWCRSNGQFVRTVLCCSPDNGAIFRLTGGTCKCVLPGGVQKVVPKIFCKRRGGDAVEEEPRKKKRPKPKKRWWKHIPFVDIVDMAYCAEEYQDCLDRAEAEYLHCYGTCEDYLPEDQPECYDLCDEIYTLDVAICATEFAECGLWILF